MRFVLAMVLWAGAVGCKAPALDTGDEAPQTPDEDEQTSGDGDKACAAPPEAGACAVGQISRRPPSQIVVWVEDAQAVGGGRQLQLTQDIPALHNNQQYIYHGSSSQAGSGGRCYSGEVYVYVNSSLAYGFAFDGYLSASIQSANSYEYNARLTRYNGLCTGCPKESETLRKFTLTPGTSQGGAQYTLRAKGVPQGCDIGVDLLELVF